MFGDFGYFRYLSIYLFIHRSKVYVLSAAQVERHSEFPQNDQISQYIPFFAKYRFKKYYSSHGFSELFQL